MTCKIFVFSPAGGDCKFASLFDLRRFLFSSFKMSKLGSSFEVFNGVVSCFETPEFGRSKLFCWFEVSPFERSEFLYFWSKVSFCRAKPRRGCSPSKSNSFSDPNLHLNCKRFSKKCFNENCDERQSNRNLELFSRN